MGVPVQHLPHAKQFDLAELHGIGRGRVGYRVDIESIDVVAGALATLNERVWNRSLKNSPDRLSSVTNVTPSLDPESVQSRGSRSGASFAEVIV